MKWLAALTAASMSTAAFADRYGINEDGGESGDALGVLFLGILIGAFAYEIWRRKK